MCNEGNAISGARGVYAHVAVIIEIIKSMASAENPPPSNRSAANRYNRRPTDPRPVEDVENRVNFRAWPDHRSTENNRMSGGVFRNVKQKL